MAYETIAIDDGNDGGTATDTSLTWSHTCTGSNRILFVTVNISPATDNLTGITYGGVAMTQIGKPTLSTTRTYLYYLYGPASGENDVVVTCSESTTMRGCSASYTGALQDVIDASSTGTAADTSITTALDPVADNCWIVSGVGNEGQVSAAGTGTTGRGAQSTSSIGDTNAAVTPPNSTNMQWTAAGSVSFSMIMASFSPAEKVSSSEFFALF